MAEHMAYLGGSLVYTFAAPANEVVGLLLLGGEVYRHI